MLAQIPLGWASFAGGNQAKGSVMTKENGSFAQGGLSQEGFAQEGLAQKGPDGAGAIRRGPLMRLLPLAVMILAAVLVYWQFRDVLTFEALQSGRADLETFRDAHFWRAIVVFVLVYAVIVALSLPGATVATLTGGFLFGLWPGALLNILGATLGAVAIFLAVRYGIGRGLAERIDAGEGRVARIKAGLDRNQWSMLFFIRFVPVIPFFAANLLPALLNVGLRPFAISTFFGIMPGAIVYTSIGSGLGALLDRGQSPDLSVIFEPYILGPLLGLAALSILPMLLRRRSEDLT
jgi:uncharacterized membrane protein YdjX (TVP38/TMEM64 family)